MNDLQPSLFQPVAVPANLDPDATLAEQFEAYHARNPHVYRAIVRMARDLRRKGVTRWGIANLVEKLRFDYAVMTDGDEFRLNNNYRAFYARLIMQNEPDLAGFFELRTQRWETHTL